MVPEADRFLIYLVAGLVTVAWFASVMAGIFVHGYQTPLPVHALEGTVVGGLIGDHAVRRAKRRVREVLDALDAEE